MNKHDMIQALEAIENAKRIYRDKAANFVLNHPETFPFLLEILFDMKSKIHIKAAWVLELVCQENLELLKPYINTFILSINILTNESSLRPVSKVCWFLSKAYFSTNRLNIIIPKESAEQIITCNFDWLIEEHKVATQVFAMDTLYLWGGQHQWIHAELKLILQNKTVSASSGYQSHARKILKNL